MREREREKNRKRERVREREREREKERKMERKIDRERERQRESDNSSITFCFENPGSTTKTIPSIVREVSAILVLTTTFLPTEEKVAFN